MLRITGLSLLLGLALLVTGLAMLSPSSTATGKNTMRMIPEQAMGLLKGSNAFVKNGTLHLPAPENGVVHVPFTFPSAIQAIDYPFVHLSIIEPRADHEIFLTWKRTDTASAEHRYKIESLDRDSLWLSSRELPGWTGGISAVGLRFTAMHDVDTYAVRDLSLHSSNLESWLQALYDDWLAYETWDQSSINSYTGVTQASSFYRTPINAALLLFSLLAYVALVLMSRGKTRFNWYPVGLLFMSCWLLMDLGWQHRLLSQLADTRHQFSGLSSYEKLQRGPDAELVDFVEQAKQLMTPDTRVFVASQENYKGLRVAYFLYPHNAYWNGQARLPPRVYYRSGDLIAAVDAPHIKYRRADSKLIFPGTRPISVDVVTQHSAGTWYRVK
ncbi:MAG: hypothetical protein ACI9NT_001131 [Bacteroidia bacterium]|jgi:hypothetical protein